MSWQVELTVILRHLINDLGSTPSYTDSRLEEVLAVSAHLVLTDTTFDTEYSIDVDESTISPDPTTSSPKDSNFITLVCLKAACLISYGEAKTYAISGMRITDGPSSIDMGSVAQSMMARQKDICDKYQAARKQYLIGNAKGVAAVIGPYTNESVDIIPWNF